MQISLRDAMIPAAGCSTKAPDFAEALREIGVDQIELWVEADRTVPHFCREDSTPHSIAEASDLVALQSDLRRHNIGVAALCLPTDYADENSAAQIDWSIAAIGAAQQLGAPVVRIDTATRRGDLGVEEVRDRFVAAIEAVLQATENSGVDLGIENHGHISNDPAYLAEIFRRVPDPRLGLTLDTGNFYWFGFPLDELYNLLERLAPRARHTHVKNIAYPAEVRDVQREAGWEYGQFCAPLDEGNIDIARVVFILKNAGYKRTLCIENEALGKYAPDERLKVLWRDAQALRAAIAAAN